MKYLIAGLGNIGREYANTRHNIGFQVLDFLAAQKEVIFSQERYGDICQVRHKGRTFILLKPNTYMNLSGSAVRYWLQKEKLEKENLLVVLDDLALPFGKLRLRASGNDGGHNGLTSIRESLGTQDYPRLRIGIGNEFQKGRQVDHVLGEWSETEEKGLEDICKKACEAIFTFGTMGIGPAMNAYNK